MLKQPAGLPDHDPGVAVPAGHRGAGPGHAGRDPDRHRRRDPRGGGQQARLAPGPDPGAAGAPGHAEPRPAAAADRAVGHPAADRGGGPAAGRRRRGPPPPRRLAALRDRGQRAPPRPRPGPGTARRRARRGRVGRADGRDPGPDRRARAAAPDHAGVREHPPDGRAGRPPAGRAARRRPRRRPPRQPVQGPAAAGGVPAAQRRPAGPGRDRVAGAGHRHRAGRAGVPDRLAAQLRHVPAAGGPVQPHPHRHARRAGCTRRPGTSWWSARPCCAGCGRAGSTR